MKIVGISQLLFITAALLSSGCTMMMPKATPEDANRVMAEASRFQGRSGQNLGSSEQYRKPIREGQWVASLMRSKSDPNDLTLQVMKVINVQGDSVTIETEQYSATNAAKRSVIQQTIRNFPVKARTAYSSDDAAALIQDIDVSGIKMMDETGQVTTMPQLPFGIGRAGSDLIKTNVATGEIRTEQCSSSNYRASKCYIIPFEAKILWMSENGITYAHSAVPIVGFIRSESDKHDIEVIGFSDRGAQALIR